jgi:hypothetical protein
VVKSIVGLHEAKNLTPVARCPATAARIGAEAMHRERANPPVADRSFCRPHAPAISAREAFRGAQLPSGSAHLASGGAPPDFGCEQTDFGYAPPDFVAAPPDFASAQPGFGYGQRGFSYAPPASSWRPTNPRAGRVDGSFAPTAIIFPDLKNS